LNLWSKIIVLYFLLDHPLHSIYRTSNFDQLYSPEGRKTEEKKHTRINLTN